MKLLAIFNRTGRKVLVLSYGGQARPSNRMFVAWLSDRYCTPPSNTVPSQICPDLSKWKKGKRRPQELEHEVDALWEYAKGSFAGSGRFPTGRPANAQTVGVPLWARLSWGFQGSIGYDRLEVFPEDIAQDSSKINSYEGEVGGFLRFFPKRSFALSLRVGGNLKNKPKVIEFERCDSQESSDTRISGKACKDSLILKEDPKSKISGYAEGAIVFVPVRPGQPSLVPGFEIRQRFEGIGQSTLSRSSGGLFVTPTNGEIVTRFGLAIEYVTKLEANNDNVSEIRPVLLVGGSL